MRDKQGDILTDRQARVVRAMSHTWELAADIARRAEVDNRGIGAVLRGLYVRGMVNMRYQYGAVGQPLEWRLV